MEKKLSHIIRSLLISNRWGKEDICITGLAYDSREVRKNFLFFALPGVHVNGNKFILQAITNGAAGIIFQGQIEKSLIDKNPTVVFLQVENTRFAMSPVADLFFDSPSKKMVIYGVTGTEGKSTTVFLIWQLLRLLGKKCGFISTVEFSLGDQAVQNREHQTTPEAPIIQEKLYAMWQNGCTHAVVESSSHGLSPKTNRLGNVFFDATAFMNVTHEHLEFHGTYEQYRNDKANLFRALNTNCEKSHISARCGAVNLEDPASAVFAQATKQAVWGFCTKAVLEIPPEIQNYLEARNIHSDLQSVDFTIELKKRHESDTFLVAETHVAHINLPGEFNVYNVLATLILVNQTTGIPFAQLVPLVSQCIPVRGRMTPIDLGQPFEVIVDYAHTPSSFETIFPPIKNRAQGKIISLFGSGGERDTKKRLLQGEIAAKYSDIVILADEDPRGEDPLELLEMIAEGCKRDGKKLVRDAELFVIPHRPTAIRKAFSLAQKNDIVLLLGKGHENSIIGKTTVVPYDEITEATTALQEMGFAKKSV